MQPTRLHPAVTLLLGWLLTCLMSGTTCAAEVRSDPWPAWQRFKQLYVSQDGRVIDASVPQQLTTSEGQSYGLFFALVANDRDSFASLLRWTHANLAHGDLRRQLPAWQWGRAEDGSWRVLDANPASDADLWIVYSLAQAGRLWCDTELAALSRDLANRMLREEVMLVPGLGSTLLPAPQGFVAQQTWRLSASYAPIQLLRNLARSDPQWRAVLKSSEQVIMASAPRGFAADWIQYRTAEGFSTDRITRGIGSYNAIRVYLWAGMLPPSDPLHGKLARQLAPMILDAAQRTAPAEMIDSNTVVKNGEGSPGFSAALLPMLVNAKQAAALLAHRTRAENQALQSNQAYYSDVLTLFGLGWLERRYQFGSAGNLNVTWKSACTAAR